MLILLFQIVILNDYNQTFYIIFEDKTFTEEHSEQLKKYKKTAMDWCKENNRTLICVYLKTGTQSLSSLKIVSEKGFFVVNRQDLIGFFNQFYIDNAIYIDFLEKILNLEKAENAYETEKIGKWDLNCWTGFYSFLDSKLTIEDWKYVPNAAGGFLGIWWHFLEWKDYYVYLQIEQGNLCFKIGEVYENHKEIRGMWYEILMEKVRQFDYKEIVKPIRFGSGTYMTVGIVEQKNWLGNNNRILNKEDVIKVLKKYEMFLDSCLK